MKRKHYIAVGTNELTGGFAFCSIEHTDISFCRVLSNEQNANEETVCRWHDWRQQFEGNDSSNFVVVSADVSREAAFFANRISHSFQPFVPYWLDLESYVKGFCVGHGLEPLYIGNISGSATPENPLAQAVYLAELWKQIRQLPENYERLKREIDLDAIGFEIALRGGKVSSNDCGIN